MRFNNKILIIGYGAVSQCTLPIIERNIQIDPKNITVIDFEDKFSAFKNYAEKGMKFKQVKVTPKNIESILVENAGKNGMVIDLAWNIGANDIIGCCHKHNLLYVNTSVELWDPNSPKTVFDKTLYKRHMSLREMSKDWKDSTTAIIEHGANPGLISHFTKQALIDISTRIIKDKSCENESITQKDLEQIADYKKRLDFPHLAWKMGVKVIHCSERDTQITNQPKRLNEFVGTWSIEGLREEGTAPAEMGWGTHEKKLPDLAVLPPKGYGPQNQIFLSQMGLNTKVRSWVPEVGEILGRAIRHGESFTISDKLTVRENDSIVYRPTVHYAYMLCHESLASIEELAARNYHLQPDIRIMGDEITEGKDILGALVMGHRYSSWWTGSSLSIGETRRIMGSGQNATTLQVAAGVLSAVKYAIENPRKGLLIPDDLPHDYVLKIAKPYLGDFLSLPTDWNPLKTKNPHFPENPASVFNEDIWQYENFLPIQ
jgi:homospermidine synthase